MGGVKLPAPPPWGADALQARRRASRRRRLALRAEVGRLSRPRLSRRRRALHPKPRRKTAVALLPRSVRATVARAAGALRPRRRIGDRARRRARLRGAA